ncbi:MAG: MBL fold metallo-hydrolase [Spirochaetia bacterium]
MIKQYEIGPVETNTYLVWKPGEQSAVVIDPAEYSQALLMDLEDLKPEFLTVFITHAHFDHFMGVEHIRNRWKTETGLHKNDLPLWKMKGGAPLFGIEAPDIPSPDFFLEDGETVPAGGFNFRIMHTPGHAAGHVCLYLADEDVLFTGDLLFAGGIGRTDLPGGSHQQLLQNIRSKILCLPGKTVIYPGHGPSSTIQKEVEDNPWIAAQ